MHDVIRRLDSEGEQAREVYQKHNPQSQNPIMCPSAGIHQIPCNERTGVPHCTNPSGQEHATWQSQGLNQNYSRVQHDQNGTTKERQYFQNAKRGRRVLEYTEPTPPTKVCPSDLNRARLEYMQVIQFHQLSP